MFDRTNTWVVFFLLCFSGQRIWLIGDSIVARAGEIDPYLPGVGNIFWKGVGGAKCAGVVNRLLRYLHRVAYPTTLIIHLGTNDIFNDPTWCIRDRVKSNLEEIRRLLPNTRLIWSDILVRLEYAEQMVDGAGKRNMRSINKRAHGILRKELEGDNKVVVHSGIFQSGRRYYMGKKLFQWDCTHPSPWGLECLRKTWSDALIYFSANPLAYDFPPGSIRLQNQH